MKIPAQLRAATGGEGRSRSRGSTVGEALDAVFDQHDGLRERITQDGDLRRFVNVYVSGEDIRFQDGLDTAVNDGDEVTILPGGGRRLRSPRDGVPARARARPPAPRSPFSSFLPLGFRGCLLGTAARRGRSRIPGT